MYVHRRRVHDPHRVRALRRRARAQESWIFTAFSSWVLPLLGSSQNVHTLHHLGMWYLVCFTLDPPLHGRARGHHVAARPSSARWSTAGASPSAEAAMNVRSGIEADEPRPDVLVLGIGNVLWADEGFGVRAVEALHRGWEMPANVSVVDGGTQGVYLLDHVCSAERVDRPRRDRLRLRAGNAARVPRCRRARGLGDGDEPAPGDLPGAAVAGPRPRPLSRRGSP